jgi:hypothetical protein
VLEYLRHGNARKAAESQGYAHPDKAGPRLSKNPKIVAAIEDHFRTQEMTAFEVVARLSDQARAMYALYFQPDGSVDLEGMIADGKAHLIKKIYYSNGSRVVEFYDAQSALVHVGRYHGLFTDRVRVDSWQDEVIELLRSGELSADDVRAELPDEADRLIIAASVDVD